MPVVEGIENPDEHGKGQQEEQLSHQVARRYPGNRDDDRRKEEKGDEPGNLVFIEGDDTCHEDNEGDELCPGVDAVHRAVHAGQRVDVIQVIKGSGYLSHGVMNKGAGEAPGPPRMGSCEGYVNEHLLPRTFSG